MGVTEIYLQLFHVYRTKQEIGHGKYGEITKKCLEMQKTKI